jgi:hypothetical protein
MLLSCPACHARFSIEAALQDDAGRELLALLAPMEPALSRPLFAYLGLFRSASRALSWDRALRLAREVQGLCANQAALAQSLVETVASLDDKRAQPGWKPLSNHNYLKRVLESVEARALPAVLPQGGETAAHKFKSKDGQALAALEGMKRHE